MWVCLALRAEENKVYVEHYCLVFLIVHGVLIGEKGCLFFYNPLWADCKKTQSEKPARNQQESTAGVIGAAPLFDVDFTFFRQKKRAGAMKVR